MFPAGYKVIVDAHRASVTELERIAAQFVEPSIRAHPAEAAALWKRIGTPIVTADQPDGHYTGWVLSPANDVEYFRSGVRLLTKQNYYVERAAVAYGLDGDALEERRN